MKRYTVHVNRDAAADLIGIRDYIRGIRGREFAEEFTGRIVAYANTLQRAPHRGTMHNEIRPGLRTVTWDKAVTLAFSVSDKARSVTIVAIFYRGRDILTELKKRAEP